MFTGFTNMITTNLTKAFGRVCTLKPGNPADLVLLDAETELAALHHIAPPARDARRSDRGAQNAK